MAAAVVDASADRRDQAPFLHVGLTPVWKRVNIATTSTDDIGDAVLLFKFPETAYFKNTAGSLYFLSGLHDSGTPSWEADLGFGDSDGTVDTVLVSTLDESGGAKDEGENVLVADAGPWIDVGGKYLILETTAASSVGRAAADFVVGFDFAAGLREVYDDGA
jgi:hypothetical protein